MRSKTGDELARRLEMAVAELYLPARTVNLLETHLNILWVNELLNHTREDLSKITAITTYRRGSSLPQQPSHQEWRPLLVLLRFFHIDLN